MSQTSLADSYAHPIDGAVDAGDAADDDAQIVKQSEDDVMQGGPTVLMAAHLDCNEELVKAVMDAGPPRLFRCDYRCAHYRV